jgi:hypothetical protein
MLQTLKYHLPPNFICDLEMPQKKKLTWEDHQKLLEYLSDHSVKQASHQFKLTEGAIRNRLYTIRNRLSHEQAAINRIRTLQRISARVRKYTTKGSIEPEEEMP